jgi:hypothetical protein
MAEHETERAKHRQGGPGKAAKRADGKDNVRGQQQGGTVDRHGIGKGGTGGSTNRKGAPG